MRFTLSQFIFALLLLGTLPACKSTFETQKGATDQESLSEDTESPDDQTPGKEDEPTPTPTPTPIPTPPADANSLRGDPNFSESKLSSTQRMWYRRVIAGINGRHYDDRAASDDLYKYARELHGHYQSMILSYRVTGDLRILDELVRLTEIQSSKLRDSWRDTKDGETQKDGYLNWVWRYNDDYHYGKDENMMDDIKTHAILAVITYVLHLNRDLKSPAGYNYGKAADYWISHIENHFFKKWRERNRVSSSSYRVFEKAITHTTYSIVKLNLYFHKLTGNEGYLNEAKNWADYLWMDVREVSAQSGKAFVYPHGLLSLNPKSSIGYITPTTYARYSSADMVDFYIEEFHDWSSTSNMEKFTRTITDFVMFDGSDTMAGDIGGNKERGGYRASGYSNMNFQRYRISSFANLTAFDSSGEIRDVNRKVYDDVERNLEAPKEIFIPAGMFLDAVLNKR